MPVLDFYNPNIKAKKVCRTHGLQILFCIGVYAVTQKYQQKPAGGR